MEKLRRLLSVAIESILEYLPGLKPWWKLAVEECRALKNGWVAFGIFALILCLTVGYVAYYFENHSAAIAMGATNQFYQSKITTLNDTVKTLKEDIIETKRARDNFQNQALEAQHALAPWMELANTQFTSEPISKRLNLLLDRVEMMESKSPRFEVLIDQYAVTNNSIILLPKSRELHLAVANRGQETAVGVTIFLFMPLALTNVISSGWEIPPGMAVAKRPEILSINVNTWKIISQSSVPQDNIFIAHPLIISSNLPPPAIDLSTLTKLGHTDYGTLTNRATLTALGYPDLTDNSRLPYIPAQITVFSNNSKTQHLYLLLSY